MKITTTPVKKRKLYPCIKITKENNLIVFFTAPQQGLCLASGTTANIVGDYCSDWDETLFIPFTHIITLEND